MFVLLYVDYYLDICLFLREGNEPGVDKIVTYKELLQQVCKFANVLKSQGMLNENQLTF